jgi:hypothetical protein
MRLKPKTLIIAAGSILAVLLPVVIFNIRSPVLIVTEQSFIELYGEERLQKESFFSSFALFRSVKTVIIANDAGDDIVPFAVAEVSGRPYCVLFPLRFARSARLYKELYPDNPVVLLEGRYPEYENPTDSILGVEKPEYFIYKTDINDDFYRTGLVVTALKHLPVQKNDESTPETDKKGKIIVFLEMNLTGMKDVFLRGLYDRGNLQETYFYNTFSQYSEQNDISCVIFAGTGSEFMEKNTNSIPVISFTWLDPFLLPDDVVMVVNDSPWAQVRQAVKKVAAGEKNGLIKSEFLVLNRKKFGREVIALIKKTM